MPAVPALAGAAAASAPHATTSTAATRTPNARTRADTDIAINRFLRTFGLFRGIRPNSRRRRSIRQGPRRVRDRANPSAEVAMPPESPDGVFGARTEPFGRIYLSVAKRSKNARCFGGY